MATRSQLRLCSLLHPGNQKSFSSSNTAEVLLTSQCGGLGFRRLSVSLSLEVKSKTETTNQTEERDSTLTVEVNILHHSFLCWTLVPVVLKFVRYKSSYK